MLIPDENLNVYDPTAHADVQNEFSCIVVNHTLVLSNVIVVSVTVSVNPVPLLTTIELEPFFHILLSGNVNTNLPPAGTSEVVSKLIRYSVVLNVNWVFWNWIT